MTSSTKAARPARRPRVAIVCDWLTGPGGAERVVLELHRLFPEAPIYTSQYAPAKIGWFNQAVVRPSWLQKLPPSLKKLLPLMRAWTFSRLDLSAYDVVISSAGAEAKFIRPRPGACHISYIHAPTHYYWSRYQAYLQSPGWGAFDWLGRLGLRLLVGPMRAWDRRAAGRPDYLIANSVHTQADIKKYYGRSSVVIHPPVDTAYFGKASSGSGGRRHGFVIAGRQTPYKRFDLAVAACSRLNYPLTVIGDGPEHRRLVAMAGSSVNFLGHVSRPQLRRRLQQAEAFIFPGLDDFGIAAVEAMASGTPVIAFCAGGALDFIRPGQSGQFFRPQTVEALTDALRQFKSMRYSAPTVRRSAAAFDASRFRQNLSDYLKRII